MGWKQVWKENIQLSTKRWKIRMMSVAQAQVQDMMSMSFCIIRGRELCMVLQSIQHRLLTLPSLDGHFIRYILWFPVQQCLQFCLFKKLAQLLVDLLEMCQFNYYWWGVVVSCTILRGVCPSKLHTGAEQQHSHWLWPQSYIYHLSFTSLTEITH